MKCSLEGCPGEYEEQRILHALRHQGQIVVIDGVPAEVCSVCADVLLGPEALRHIERLLARKPPPVSTALLYQYA